MNPIEEYTEHKINERIEREIRDFSRKCIDSPQLERDPVCVIATVREDTCARLHQAEEWAERTSFTRNGRHK